MAVWGIGLDSELWTFKALSDRTRLRAFMRIMKSPICTTELAAEMGISQPAATQHLRILEKTNLVSFKRKGRNRIYFLTKKGVVVVHDLSDWAKIEPK